MLEIAKTKGDLPEDTQTECPICLENIDLDEIKNGMPNCMICDEGHRTHRDCFSKYTKKHACPFPDCGNKNMRNCKSNAGYSYAPRKGGKRQSKKFTKKNRSHKRRRSNKRRRSLKRRK
jgi:hypothetical protein